VLPVL